MKQFIDLEGVPNFTEYEYSPPQNKYVLLIPIINEGNRIHKELQRAKRHQISKVVDIVICDGGSSDGSTNKDRLCELDVNTLLVKDGKGKQGAQLRMGMWWSIKRGYKGIITIDGNDKDSIEDVPRFVKKLEEGYDYVQGSRFIQGGRAINTPLLRLIAVKFIHAPVISITAHHRFTDTTNAFRGYSLRYLCDERVKPFREIFDSYELLAYLSVRSTQLGMKVCEIPVTRKYPSKGIPTKISPIRGNIDLLRILFKNMCGVYRP